MADHEKHDDHGEGGHGGGGHGGGHHGPGGHAAHEEHEEGWIVSFADNCLLQMGFFVILLALNLKPAATGGGAGGPGGNGWPTDADPAFIDGILAIREAFGSLPDMNSTVPGDQALIRRMKERMSQGETRAPGPAGNKKNVQAPDAADTSSTYGLVTFADHSTQITPEWQPTIDDFADAVKGNRWLVEVRGHAAPSEAFGNEETARRLSYDRAFAAGQALARAGVDWSKIRLIAVGTADPAKPRAFDTTGRSENRRVEMILTDKPMPKDPFTREE